MKRDWLSSIALRLVPSSWRDAIGADIEEDAGALHRGAAWRAWQTASVGIRLRLTFAWEAIVTEVWHAIRSLMSARWFTAGAALTFALGIGVNLAVFSAVDRLLFRKLPYANSHELMLLRVCSAFNDCNGSFPAVLAYEGRARLHTIGEMAVAAMPTAIPFSSAPDEERRVRLTGVSPNLLRVLGVTPVVGRDMTDDDLRSMNRVVLLANESWQRRFDGTPDIIGRVLGSAASPATVIGVLPRGFIPPTWTAPDPTWDGLILDLDGWATIGPEGGITVPFARLTPGATREAAQAEVRALVQSLDDQFRSGAKQGGQAPVVWIDPIDTALFSRFTDYAWLIVGAAAVVLLMACANLAGLLLARGRSRERESAVRSALGASPLRIVWSAVLETATVCVLGAIVAVLVLAWSSHAIAAALPPLFGRYLAGVTDARVLLFALGTAVVCAIVAGAWPGVRMARVDIKSVLQGAGWSERRRRLPGGRSLLAVEAALGVFLVLAALLAVRSFSVLSREDIGYRPENLYRITVSTPPKQPPAQQLADYDQMLQAVAAIPGVIAVGGSDAVVSSGAGAMQGFSTAEPRAEGGRYEVSAGYFATLQSDLLAGREFSGAEVASRAPVAVLSASAASAIVPGALPRDAVGRSVIFDKDGAREIVGVAKDLRPAHGAAVRPAIFVPLGTAPRFYRQLLVRTASGSAPQLPVVRARLTERVGERTVAVAAVATSLEPSLQDPRFRAVLFATLGLCALCLAAAGLYALASFETSLRRYEMGVRMSLGATARRIRAQVLRQAIWPVLIGSAAGLVGAWWLGRFLQEFLYKVEARDPWMYAAVAAALVATALLAAWRPANRASRTDPAKVLRAP